MIWPFRKKKIMHSYDSFEMALRLVEVAREQLAICTRRRRRLDIQDGDFRMLEKIRDAFNHGFRDARRAARDLEARMKGQSEGVQTRKWEDYR